MSKISPKLRVGLMVLAASLLEISGPVIHMAIRTTLMWVICNLAFGWADVRALDAGWLPWWPFLLMTVGIMVIFAVSNALVLWAWGPVYDRLRRRWRKLRYETEATFASKK